MADEERAKENEGEGINIVYKISGRQSFVGRNMGHYFGVDERT